MVSTNQNWLEQVKEEVLEPDLPICDPHHHLWDLRPERIEPRYLLDEILVDLRAGHNIVSTVFIECGAMFKVTGQEALWPVGETEFVNGFAAMSASGVYGSSRIAAGIVGTAELRLGARVAEVLEAHIAAGGGRFRGIRCSATWDASPEIPNHRTNPIPDLYGDHDFRNGFAVLASYDLSFEAWCYQTQLPELAKLARAYPDNRIVLDHCGGPLGIGPYAEKRDEGFSEWRDNISAIAQCENVVAKLGGLNMEIVGFGWHERVSPPTSEELLAATRPYLEHMIESFGPERCMFESNFPVDKVSSSYLVLWNSFKRLTANYSAAEKERLYHDTATATYRL